MKRLLCFCAVFAVLSVVGAIRCKAEVTDVFDSDVQQIEDSVDNSAADDLQEINAGSVSAVTAHGVDTAEMFNYLFGQISKESKGPLAAVALLIPVLIFASIAESYTHSLRYSDTREIMGTMVSLFTASVMINPLTGMITSSAAVIKGSAALMTVYLPVMAGMLLFSGHAITSGGYYAAVVTASQLVSRFSASVLVPLLNIFLALSVCSGVSASVRIGGLIQSAGKLFKTCITFAMSIFIAVIGLNSAITGAADSVANKAARFGLSSFVPIIGASVADAYGAIQSGVTILRSGVGVFVILAVFVSFVPLLVRVTLWSVAVFIAQTAGEALSVSSALSVLQSLSVFLSALRALLIAVMTVFIISSAAMIMIGGGS